MEDLRVAVVGSGPAGIYAAALTAHEDAAVDVIDRLATPFGLVRYGVAPDHEKMKSVAVALRKVKPSAERIPESGTTIGPRLRLVMNSLSSSPSR